MLTPSNDNFIFRNQLLVSKLNAAYVRILVSLNYGY